MIQRYNAPESNNKFYLNIAGGGFNKCIKISGNSVLPNCVGYAYGRFMESGGITQCTLSAGDAENWWDYPDGYARGQTPRPGAVMCWRKGAAHYGDDGRGHVEFVEQVNPDGSVITTGSDYGGTRFYRHTRMKPYVISGQTFQGFIYNPYVNDINVPDFESDLTINGHLYHLYGQADGLTAVVLSPGLNKTAKIQNLDCDYWVYAKITGCNYYQMREDIPDQPYGTTYGPISSPLCDVYQTLPNQDTTMYFDIETGEHADCTGVTIDAAHNIFSPALIYQRGKNVQYARMVGQSLRNNANMYAFLIRYNDGRYCFGLTDKELTPNQINDDIMSIGEVDSISIIDGGGSAQMMRYLAKEKHVEYTRDTGRATAGCIAFIGKPIASQDTLEPPKPSENEQIEDEPQKDEEEPMEENKPQNQPEKEPEEVPKKIELSGKVMSLITIMLTCALVYMVIFSIEVPDFFQKCYLLILTTFFTKGTAKAITDK